MTSVRLYDNYSFNTHTPHWHTLMTNYYLCLLILCVFVLRANISCNDYQVVWPKIFNIRYSKVSHVQYSHTCRYSLMNIQIVSGNLHGEWWCYSYSGMYTRTPFIQCQHHATCTSTLISERMLRVQLKVSHDITYNVSVQAGCMQGNSTAASIELK